MYDGEKVADAIMSVIGPHSGLVVGSDAATLRQLAHDLRWGRVAIVPVEGDDDE